MEKVLEVRNLKLSFRTSGGILRAVRGISFDLEKGRTLAIVGESGSGKSVTSRAILGITAGNTIVEGGEILYNGMDLLKISEEEMCSVRGGRISMIFQDPLSSLNPIIRIGKQITEAMLLKNAGSRREAKREFNAMLEILKENVAAAVGKSAAEKIGAMKNPGQRLQNDDFMQEFIDLAAKGAAHSAKVSADRKRALLPVLKEARKVFAQGELDRTAARKKVRELSTAVIEAIDRLETVRDSLVYTFPTSLGSAVDRYFDAVTKNCGRGKTDGLKAEIAAVIDGLITRFDENTAQFTGMDFRTQGIALADWFREKAAQSVYTVTRKKAKEKAIRLMEEVGIPEPRIRYDQYPFEFSGGMRQRIVIAIALAADPDILICDEPTTALDVTIQAQILELIGRLRKERGLSVIFITHDLGVVANMADHVAVMYAGKIVEYGTVDEVFYDPRHPYTWALLSSMPDLETTEKLEAIPGTPPDMIHPPKGDAFAERNRYAMRIDFEQDLPEFRVSDTHWAATWLLHPDAPKAEMPRIIAQRIERMKNTGDRI